MAACTELLRSLTKHCEDRKSDLVKVSDQIRVLNTNLVSAKESLRAANIKLAKAQTTRNETSEQVQKLSNSLDRSQRQANQLKPAIKLLKLRHDNLRERYRRVKRFFKGNWEDLFLWEEVLNLSEREYEGLVESVDQLVDLLNQYSDDKAAFDNLIPDALSSPSKSQNLAEAGYAVTEDSREITKAIDSLVGGQLAHIQGQFDNLPKLPPAALSSSHDDNLSKHESLKSELGTKRRILINLWTERKDELGELIIPSEERSRS